MNFTSLKIIILMWQYELVDTFTFVNFIYNSAVQYSAIVVAAMAEGNFTQLPSMFFEPIAGLQIGSQYIKAGQTAAERRARVATLAALLSTSTDNKEVLVL